MTAPQTPITTKANGALAPGSDRKTVDTTVSTPFQNRTVLNNKTPGQIRAFKWSTDEANLWTKLQIPAKEGQKTPSFNVPQSEEGLVTKLHLSKHLTPEDLRPPGTRKNTRHLKGASGISARQFTHEHTDGHNMDSRIAVWAHLLPHFASKRIGSDERVLPATSHANQLHFDSLERHINDILKQGIDAHLEISLSFDPGDTEKKFPHTREYILWNSKGVFIQVRTHDWLDNRATYVGSDVSHIIQNQLDAVKTRRLSEKEIVTIIKNQINGLYEHTSRAPAPAPALAPAPSRDRTRRRQLISGNKFLEQQPSPQKKPRPPNRTNVAEPPRSPSP